MSVAPECEQEVLELAAAHAVPVARLGESGGPRVVFAGLIETSVEELRTAFTIGDPAAARRDRDSEARVLEAVTFDYWQTLVAERPGEMRAGQIHRFAATLEESGQPRDAEELEVGVRRELGSASRSTGTRTPARTPPRTRSTSSCEQLGIDLREGLRARLIEGFREVGEAVHLDLAPGIEESLAGLRRRGPAPGHRL